ncbi:MAG: hypothetical protein Q9221_008632, partial [Calogaya cf. arnoldii]
MHDHEDLELILHTTYYGILQAIVYGTLSVADHISQFLSLHDIDTTWSLIKAAVLPSLLILVNGVSESFSGLELDSFRQDTSTTKQDVYAMVVLFTSHYQVYRMYVGSAYSKNGIRGRVHDAHLNPKHRAAEPEKYLYRCMDHRAAQSYPVCLLRFDTSVDIAIPLISEAMMVCVFGTFKNSFYKRLRHAALHDVDWQCGANQNDPLIIGDSTLAWKGCLAYKRNKKLENALMGGPVKVRRPMRGRKNPWTYVSLWDNVRIGINQDTVAAWRLTNGSVVNMLYDIQKAGHPHAFALDAPKHSDAFKLGIQFSKQINGVEQTVWSQRDGMNAVRTANSLYDWISGRIDDDVDNHQWGEDRLPLFGAQAASQVKPRRSVKKKPGWAIKKSTKAPTLARPQLSLAKPTSLRSVPK